MVQEKWKKKFYSKFALPAPYLCRKNILIYYFEIEISHYELDKSDKHMIKIIWLNYNINDDTVSHYRYSRTIDFFSQTSNMNRTCTSSSSYTSTTNYSLPPIVRKQIFDLKSCDVKIQEATKSTIFLNLILVNSHFGTYFIHWQ